MSVEPSAAPSAADGEETPMEMMEMGKMEKMTTGEGSGAAQVALEARLAKLTLTQKRLYMFVAIAIGIACMFGSIGIVRELQWRHRISSVQKSADSALRVAHSIAMRKHHGGDTLKGDLSALASLVTASTQVDATIAENVQKTQDASGSAAAADVQDEKALAATKTQGLERAIASTIRALEKDVAHKHGHPLIIRHGLPSDVANKKIAKLGSALLKTEAILDKGNAANQKEAMAIAQGKGGLLTDGKPMSKKTAKALKADLVLGLAKMKELEKFSKTLFSSLQEVANDAR